MEQLSLINLKQKARKYYRQYFAILNGVSCGGNLLETFSSRAYRLKKDFNIIMDEIAKLDPNCPKARL